MVTVADIQHKIDSGEIKVKALVLDKTKLWELFTYISVETPNRIEENITLVLTKYPESTMSYRKVSSMLVRDIS